MVKPEIYRFDKRGQPLRARLVAFRPIVTMKTLERAANGAWFVIADLAFTFDLLDGRKVTINKHVRLRGEQEGKRPHPNAFGRGKPARTPKNRK